MKAKFINEIKQNVSDTGLGAMGIGKVSMFRAYHYFKRAHPESISSETIEKFLEEIKPMIDEEKLKLFLRPPYDDYIKIMGLSNSYMGNYLENLRGHSSTAYISTDDDNYYIHSFYNFMYNVGFFHEVTPTGSQYIYFVKYK